MIAVADAGCEEGAERVAIGSELPVCGAHETIERGLDCASPFVSLERGVEANTDTLFAVTHRGRLDALVLDGNELGPVLLQAQVSDTAAAASLSSVCDFNGNGVTDIAHLSFGAFVVWDLTSPGDPSVPSSIVPWDGLTRFVCDDLDDDGFDELYGFDEASRVIVGAGENGLVIDRPYAVDTWADGFLPILAVARDPECAPVLLGRSARVSNGVLVANEATLFTVGESGLEPADELVVDQGVIGDLFLEAAPGGLRAMLWVQGDAARDRLLLYEAGTGCDLDLEPVREVELPGHAMRVDVDRDRQCVEVIHQPSGDAELFGWGSDGSFEPVRFVEGPALDVAVVGPPDDEHLVIARPSPPFLEIEPL